MVRRHDKVVNQRDIAPHASLDEADVERFRSALLAWYRANARDLPWRATRDPYAILVSELMLQQTQVATVVPYYQRFLSRFPTVESLAAAHEAEVLTYWAGLGYYRRARLLLSAAGRIRDVHGGVFPDALKEIRTLPGVGDYTAGAVASFAFGEASPLVDANVARVLARVYRLEEPVQTAASRRLLWRWAGELLAPDDPRAFNNALMELGALVCAPAVPRCADCPVASVCGARRAGVEGRLPVLRPAPLRVARHFAGIVVACDGRFLMRRIPPGEWHAGMWEFPKVPCDGPPPRIPAALRRMLHPVLRGVRPALLRDVGYVVTRHDVTLRLWRADVRTAACPARGDEFQWATRDDALRLPLPSPQKRIVKLLADDSESVGIP